MRSQVQLDFLFNLFSFTVDRLDATIILSPTYTTCISPHNVSPSSLVAIQFWSLSFFILAAISCYCCHRFLSCFCHRNRSISLPSFSVCHWRTAAMRKNDFSASPSTTLLPLYKTTLQLCLGRFPFLSLSLFFWVTTTTESLLLLTGGFLFLKRLR